MVQPRIRAKVQAKPFRRHRQLSPSPSLSLPRRPPVRLREAPLATATAKAAFKPGRAAHQRRLQVAEDKDFQEWTEWKRQKLQDRDQQYDLVRDHTQVVCSPIRAFKQVAHTHLASVDFPDAEAYTETQNCEHKIELESAAAEFRATLRAVEKRFEDQHAACLAALKAHYRRERAIGQFRRDRELSAENDMPRRRD
jgi:hypothetical protein